MKGAKQKKERLFLDNFFLIVAQVKTKKNFYADLGCNPGHYKVMVKALVWARSQPASQLSAVMAHLLFTLDFSIDFVSLNYRNETFHH